VTADAQVTTTAVPTQELTAEEGPATADAQVTATAVPTQELTVEGGSATADAQVTAMAVPTQELTVKLLEPIVLKNGATYKKTGMAFLKRASTGLQLETGFDGKMETVNTANHGDWVVRADTSAKERFYLPDHKFKTLYESAPMSFSSHEDAEELEAEGFKAYRPRGRIVALVATAELLAEHFPQGKFIASWGSEMLVEVDDILAAPAPPEGVGLPESIKEVYRIEKGAFAQTYLKEE